MRIARMIGQKSNALLLCSFVYTKLRGVTHDALPYFLVFCPRSGPCGPARPASHSPRRGLHRGRLFREEFAGSLAGSLKARDAVTAVRAQLSSSRPFSSTLFHRSCKRHRGALMRRSIYKQSKKRRPIPIHRTILYDIIIAVKFKGGAVSWVLCFWRSSI